MITLICGPMYSGKSTTLIQKMERYTYAKKKVLLIRPNKDDRGYLTHNETAKKEIKYNIFKTNSFTEEEVKKIILTYDAVFIDEYFMINNCKLFCEIIPENKHCDIYFAGLLASSENKLFSETISVLPYCDEIIKLNGVCVGIDKYGCGSQYGNYSAYFGATKKTSDILVGDSDYKCLCRKCYKKAFRKL